MATIARYMRQSGIINVKDYQDNAISIVGCGAIGSTVAVALAKMGFTKFELWDFDSVEDHNLPNQFFKEAQIGLNKAVATSSNMSEFNSDIDVDVCTMKFEKQQLKGQIVVASVDTMAARKLIFEACKRDASAVGKHLCQLYIDTRMGGLEGQIYFVDMSDESEILNYEKTLFSDEQAVRERCTERAIIFTVFGMASMVCCEIMKALLEQPMRNYIVMDFKEIQVM
jgi:molybdopterin/thiamine biosynthesis adenylyltransferase